MARTSRGDRRGKQMSIKTTLLLIATACAIAACTIAGHIHGACKQERGIHLREISELNLKVHDMGVALDTLMRIGVRIDIMDHTGIWMVGNAREMTQ